MKEVSAEPLSLGAQAGGGQTVLSGIMPQGSCQQLSGISSQTGGDWMSERNKVRSVAWVWGRTNHLQIGLNLPYS